MPPKRNWIQEERRKVLGDWVALCLGCGHAHRWFDEFESEVPTECPQCGGPIRRRCVECNAPFASVFAVECEECGAALRDPTLFGIEIRKRPRERGGSEAV